MPPPRTMISGKQVLVAALGLCLLITLGVTLIALATRRPTTPPPMPRQDLAPVRSERVPTPAPAPAPARPPAPAPGRWPDALAGVDLATPRAAVDAQVALLRTGRDDAFRETFVPALRHRLTRERIVACREYLTAMGNRAWPEWDSLANDTEDGHPVVRLRMTQGALVYTTYHQTDGRWLADQVWCLPREQNALPSEAL